MIGEFLALLGSLLVLLAAIGGVRFEDTLSRMHALAKASTLGIILLLLGAALNLDDAADITSVALAGLLHLVSTPASSNLVSRAVYLAYGMPSSPGTIDEGAALRRDT